MSIESVWCIAVGGLIAQMIGGAEFGETLARGGGFDHFGRRFGWRFDHEPTHFHLPLSGEDAFGVAAFSVIFALSCLPNACAKFHKDRPCWCRSHGMADHR